MVAFNLCRPFQYQVRDVNGGVRVSRASQRACFGVHRPRKRCVMHNPTLQFCRDCLLRLRLLEEVYGIKCAGSTRSLESKDA